jgi:transcription elongation factor Elf1
MRKNGVKINVSDTKQWYICPNCGQKILKYTEKAKSRDLFIKCKNCKQEIEIKIE